jgi:hypothetical protein
MFGDTQDETHLVNFHYFKINQLFQNYFLKKRKLPKIIKPPYGGFQV